MKRNEPDTLGSVGLTHLEISGLRKSRWLGWRRDPIRRLISSSPWTNEGVFWTQGNPTVCPRKASVDLVWDSSGSACDYSRTRWKKTSYFKTNNPEWQREGKGNRNHRDMCIHMSYIKTWLLSLRKGELQVGVVTHHVVERNYLIKAYNQIIIRSWYF